MFENYYIDGDKEVIVVMIPLSSIIIATMLRIIDYEAAIHLWQVDEFDFVVCISAYLGVVFESVEIGLVIAVALLILRVLLLIARPRTVILGNISDSMIYGSMDQERILNLMRKLCWLVSKKRKKKKRKKKESYVGRKAASEELLLTMGIVQLLKDMAALIIDDK